MVGRIIVTVLLAMIVGKLVTKIKLPAILGWLITGMILGPYALNLLSQDVLDATWYHNVSRFLECAIGIMFAKDLVIRKLKKYGKQIAIITLFESLGTFLVVTLTFGVIFYFMEIPLYLAMLFGGIALATAPAPAISIVSQFRTKGPVTNTLLPLAILDDVVALAVFFTINSYVAAMGSTTSSSVIAVIGMTILLPIGIGIALGFAVSPIFNRKFSKRGYMIATLSIIIVTYFIGFAVDNFILPAPAINYMMLGMAVFSTIANRVSNDNLEQISSSVMPVVGIGFVVMILNLAAPLDYRLIFAAGIMTIIYIISRAFGKYFSTFFGAKVAKAEPTVKKYLGFTLLPHSGVSLVFTGMAVTSLATFDNESAVLIKGTIAAAAVINEIFAVIIAKKAFEWAGELDTGKNKKVEEKNA